MALTPYQAFAVTFFVAWILWRLLGLLPQKRPALRSVAVLVLGDIGRSPRMMYHAESFAKIDFNVYLVGYRGSKPVPSLTRLPHVRFVYLTEFPGFGPLPFILLAPFKVLHQIISIINALYMKIPQPPEFIIVQNPPSIPTLALVWLFGTMTGSKIIIDWHNLGYSILALKLGNSHPFVRLAKRFEATFGRSAFAHLFVTDALRDYLTKEWNLRGQKVVLHDRPPHHFHKSSPQETHDLFLKLLPSLTLNLSLQNFLPEHKTPLSTPFTHVPSKNTATNVGFPIDYVTPDTTYGMPDMREDRPALLVSSTSWTADEDFSILLDALALYEKAAVDRKGKLPRALCIITGKGPLKGKYMKEVEEMQRSQKWQYVRCVSAWLAAEDYPILLGSADIGISLHSSSSAMDLPMKIVDMFGCGLPVCALDFACINELVKDGVNGLTFKTASQLSRHLTTLLGSFPTSPELQKLQKSLQTSSEPDGQSIESHWGCWEDNWNRVVRPLVLHDVTSASSPPRHE